MRQASDVLITNSKGEFLLLKRVSTAKFSPGLWDLPGGKFEEGETPLECATREALEETGLVLDIEKKPFYLYFYPNNCECCAELAAHVFRAKPIEEQQVRVDLNEHTEFRWFSKKELRILGEKATPCARAVFELL